MYSDLKQVPSKRSNVRGLSVIQFLREHPLVGYFLLAFGLQWLWEIPIFAIWHQQKFGPWVLLSPSIAGFLMAWIIDGRVGVLQLLRRMVQWRVGLRWYAIALLCVPVLLFLGILHVPGAFAAFQLPGISFLFTYVLVFALTLLTAPLAEEAGWRGFALPHLQTRHGPLRGTLVLGSLWAFWHLPIWLFIPGYVGAGSGFLGIGIPFLGWAVMTVAETVIFTWVFNHSRGSILLAVLFHTSVNVTYATLPGAFFPTLFPPERFATTAIPIFFEIGFVLVASLVVVATRGRLGYDHYQREMNLLQQTPVS
jgi:membrane protease YdiL (CAAX protease family)